MEKDKKDELEKMVVLTVRVPLYQKQYLQQFCELTDQKVPEIIRGLIDFFIEVKE
jgi:hypothetical protein